MRDKVKISGFTFARNTVRLDYPIVESIKSILPIVDEYVVNVGPDEDGTLDLIQSIGDPKIKTIQSQWNPNLNSGGYLSLSRQTLPFSTVPVTGHSIYRQMKSSMKMTSH